MRWDEGKELCALDAAGAAVSSAVMARLVLTRALGARVLPRSVVAS